MKTLPTIAALLALFTLAALGPAPAQAQYVGVNLAGADFGSVIPGTYNVHYTYPTTTELDYYKARGFVLIRLGFRWERIQHSLHGALNAAELGRLTTFLTEAQRRGMRVILDMHNYGRYRISGTDYIIGSPQVPRSAFQDVWSRIAQAVVGFDCIYGYGIMNEPHDMGGYTWKDSAQVAINGIRAHDTKRPIFVSGDGWSSAAFWSPTNNNLATLTDPGYNLIYEAHQYFDDNYTGQYDESYDGEGAYPTIAADRLANFVNWCAANNKKGFIGELGVPDDDPRWLTVLDNALTYLQSKNMSCTVWAGGPWWSDDYELTLEMGPSHDEALQIDVMRPYGRGVPTKHWKPFVWYDDDVANGLEYSFAYGYQSPGATHTINFADTATKYSGTKAIRFAYTVPPGGYAAGSMHIQGGVNLSGNFTNNHHLTFYARGTAGSSVRVFFVTTAGVTSTKVFSSDYATLNSNWQKISIPLSHFVNAGVNGSQRLHRIIFEGLPANGTSHVVNLDHFVIEKPDTTPPTVSVNTSTGGSTFPKNTTITATATASDASGIHYVDFLVNGGRYHADASSPYAFSFSLPTPGTYNLTAIAIDNHGNAQRSNVKTLTITP